MSETHEKNDDAANDDAANDEVSAEEKEEIEQARQERLDPDSRPEGAEIDNTERDFDPKTGMFTDNPEHDEAEPQYSADDEA